MPVFVTRAAVRQGGDRKIPVIAPLARERPRTDKKELPRHLVLTPRHRVAVANVDAQLRVHLSLSCQHLKQKQLL